MGAIGAIEAAAVGIGTATSLIGRHEQEKAQQQAVELRLESQEAANTERSTQRGRRLNEIMAAQVAKEGASGLSVASPSFFAIGADSFNQFAQDSNADALNLNFDKISASRTENSLKQQEMFGDMGDLFNAGKTAFNAGAFQSSMGGGTVAQTNQQFKGSSGQQGPVQSGMMTRMFSGTDLDFIL